METTGKRGLAQILRTCSASRRPYHAGNFVKPAMRQNNPYKTRADKHRQPVPDGQMDWTQRTVLPTHRLSRGFFLPTACLGTPPRRKAQPCHPARRREGRVALLGYPAGYFDRRCPIPARTHRRDWIACHVGLFTPCPGCCAPGYGPSRRAPTPPGCGRAG